MDINTFEQEWAKWNNLPAAGMVACSSGTAALHLALEALQIPKGSKVITSDFNMVAVPVAIELAGLEPIFVDCHKHNLLMDPDLVYSQLKFEEIVGEGGGFGMASSSDYTNCILAVHIYGRRCEMDILAHISGDNYIGTRLVEDLAEAHGVRPHPRTDAATWSFYRNKIVAGQEGGAVWFRDPAHAHLARQLRCLGFVESQEHLSHNQTCPLNDPETHCHPATRGIPCTCPSLHNFDHVPYGHNYRLSPAHAELILTHLRGIGKYGVDIQIKLRNERTAWYDEQCPPSYRLPPRDAPWVYDLRIPGLTRDKQSLIVRTLNTHNIAARMSFKPMGSQKQFQHRHVLSRGQPTNQHQSSDQGQPDCYSSNAHIFSQEVFYLPLDPLRVTRESVAQTFHVIDQVMKEQS